MNFRIGKASQRIGVHPSTLRDLENRGLIPPARRDWSGYRIYSEEELNQIERILFGKYIVKSEGPRAA